MDVEDHGAVSTAVQLSLALRTSENVDEQAVFARWPLHRAGSILRARFAIPLALNDAIPRRLRERVRESQRTDRRLRVWNAKESKRLCSNVRFDDSPIYQSDGQH